MIWAIDNGERIKANPSQKALCPGCGANVISKCGEIVTWHWAHEAADCDPWHEAETEWHHQWKSQFPDSWQEVLIGNHRADIKTPDLVVEFQSSIISSCEIRERENHYGRMIWVLNGKEFSENIEFRQKKGFISFRWRWPRKAWWHAKKPIYIDLPNRFFRVDRIFPTVPCGGYGQEMTVSDFLSFIYSQR
jgi:competence CoiA-like predicted nuclease